MDIFENMTDIREVTYFAVALRILIAALLGGFMGLERGLKHRAAGLRTYMLVCVGACLIMLTNQYIFQIYGAGDPVRMGAQVVSGIGFLGAGTILITRHRQIKGLTTAAGLWSAAGVGLALGIGFYEGAVMGTTIVLAVMTLMKYIDKRMQSKTKSFEVYIELSAHTTLGELLRQLRDMDMEICDVQKQTEANAEGPVRSFTATLNAKKRTPHQEILAKLLSLEGVSYAEAI